AFHVTGVQTCALPILRSKVHLPIAVIVGRCSSHLDNQGRTVGQPPGRRVQSGGDLLPGDRQPRDVHHPRPDYRHRDLYSLTLAWATPAPTPRIASARVSNRETSVALKTPRATRMAARAIRTRYRYRRTRGSASRFRILSITYLP